MSIQLQQEAIPGNDFRNNLRVLVAEQDTAIRETLIDRVYETLGVYADAANTARAVDKLLQRHGSDIVLAVVDTRLPDAPQGEVLDALTQAEIPTIAISPEVTDEVAARLVDKHIIDCVLKNNDDNDKRIVADLVERTLLNHHREILLLSRSDFNRRMIRQMLDIHRYTVHDVRSPLEARRRLDKHPNISLVLLDHSVLETDELGFINDLRQQYRKEDLAIAAVCEQRDTRQNARLLRAGLNDVVCRPHQADEFYYRVRHCIESVERVRELKQSAIRDRLTGLYNRDYLFDAGEKAYYSALRGDIELSLAMIEIDGFDRLTLAHGNHIADAVLQNVAAIIQAQLRKNDIIARYHTATFACMASNVGKRNAQMMFERIRQIVANTQLMAEKTKLQTSLSIGVNTVLQSSFANMIGEAQRALNTATTRGGNTVEVQNGTS